MRAVAILTFVTCFILLMPLGIHAQIIPVESDSIRKSAPLRETMLKGVPLFGMNVSENALTITRALDSLARENPHLRTAILRYLIVTSLPKTRPLYGNTSMSRQLRDCSTLTQYEALSLVASRQEELFGHFPTYGLLGQLSLTGLIKWIMKASK